MLRPLLLCLFLGALPAPAADPALRDQIAELFRQRQFADARALLEKTVAADPGNAHAWHSLGRAHLALQDPQPAVSALEKAVRLEPQHSGHQHQLGHAYGLSAQKAGLLSKLSLAKKCKAAYEKAIELDPRNLDARWSLMDYCRQAPGLAGGGMDLAYAQAAEIRNLDPSRGRLALATLHVAEKKHAEAFALFDEVLATEPADYAALYQSGRLSAMTGEHLDRGLARLRQCLDQSPPSGEPGHAAVHWRMGNIHEKQGDRPAALAAYESAQTIDPAFVPARESLRKLKKG